MNVVLHWAGLRLARFLSAEVPQHEAGTPVSSARLLACLQPGDVLLVAGHSRISTAIKYLTQSSWSHAALYVGAEALAGNGVPAGHCFVEADVVDGVRSVGADAFQQLHTRICRPVSLRPDEIARVTGYAVAHLGDRYDLRHVWDLARYLLPTPPVPTRWRRHMLSLGSGDPTRAICSTLIAQSFQTVRYPILPEVHTVPHDTPECPRCTQDILQLRHHSLFTPRDFDISPYFQIVKPTLSPDFDVHLLRWQDRVADAVAPALSAPAPSSAPPPPRPAAAP